MIIKPWMVIGGVTLLVALGSNIFLPRDIKWFKRLRRPSWLTFEPLIPVFWSIAFVCGAWSAHIVWTQQPGRPGTWLLMGFYLLVEIVTVSFNPVLLRLRSLKAGTIIGATGALLGFLLALAVLPISGWAALLLVPYLIWSPIGTYTTWEMSKLNPADA
jgi:tryptophan-rich sensory protein